jgi:hypothetical protein
MASAGGKVVVSALPQAVIANKTMSNHEMAIGRLKSTSLKNNRHFFTRFIVVSSQPRGAG